MKRREEEEKKRRRRRRRRLIPDSDTGENGPNDWFEVWGREVDSAGAGRGVECVRYVRYGRPIYRLSDSRAAGNPFRGVCFLLSHSLLSVVPWPRLGTQTLLTIVHYMWNSNHLSLYVCVCVFRFQCNVSPDDPAQQAGRQQQFERWESFSAESPTPLRLLVH